MVNKKLLVVIPLLLLIGCAPQQSMVKKNEVDSELSNLSRLINIAEEPEAKPKPKSELQKFTISEQEIYEIVAALDSLCENGIKESDDQNYETLQQKIK